MSSIKLKDRISSYSEVNDYKLLNRVPIIICINGRGFSRLSSLLDKPYSNQLSECMFATLLKLCSEVDGTVFGYHFNDELVLIVKNDQSLDTRPWYDNRLQKICSVTASIATLHFNNCAAALDLNLIGDPTFLSNVFTVPSISEAVNLIVSKQQHNFHSSIQFACFYEMLNKKYDKPTIKEMLSGLSVDEKIDLLKQECDIDFNNYAVDFRRGVAAYKVPQVIDGAIKNKWMLNTELPIFTQDHSFIFSILKNRTDILRDNNL